MGQFFKFVFASCLGVCLAMLALFFLGIVSIAGLAGSADEGTIKKAESNSVLEIKLTNSIPELTDNVDKSPFETHKVSGLTDIVKGIDYAATDNNIKGIVINTPMPMMGMASASVLRQSLENFKKSGKFIYAYGDYYTHKGYYLASVADNVMINPMGGIEFMGLSAEIPFMKGLFGKLDIKWQIYYAGQFKSATEPFRLDKMSDQNRLQTREYVEGIYGHILDKIAASRNMSAVELRTIANDYSARTSHKAVALKLADTEGYYDQLLTMLRTKMGIKDNGKINTIGINDYAQSVKKTGNTAKDRIAVIYAEGDITMNLGGGSGESNGGIEGGRYAKMIRKLRSDKNIKAIVLRVNSGGGSSFASDIILRELDLARQQGIPVIASFGDYAASGGYYIAMASDSIFAEPTTLTGSIGVFGMIPGMQNTFKNKLGISFDTVKTGKYSAMSGVTIHFTDDEGKIIQESIDSTYERFLYLVSKNRGKSRDDIHAVAQGRVWLGDKAKQLGLVDAIGGLDAAINAAASKANLKTYKTVEYPKSKSGIDKFLEEFTGSKPTDELVNAALKSELGEYYDTYMDIKRLKNMKGPQMRIPFVINIK